MFEGFFHGEELGEDIRSKRLLELFRRNVFRLILRMLLACAIDEHVEAAEPVDRFLNDVTGRSLPADVARQQHALPALFLNEAPRFAGIFVLLEVGYGDVGAFLCRKHRDGPTDPTIAAGH